MRLVTDERCALSSPILLKPRTPYDAQISPDGRIILTEVSDAAIPVVKPRRIDGRLRGVAIAMPRATVAAAIRAERDSR